MDKNSYLALAISLAATGHLEQTDKGGNPYILHPIKVMRYIRSDDPELMSIAVMHDLVEDTDMTVEQLREKGFSERVCKAVDILSKKENQTEEEYLTGIIGNKDAVCVKLADLRHNSDVRRLKGLTDKDLLRMRKYHKMYKTLESVKAGYEHIESLKSL